MKAHVQLLVFMLIMTIVALGQTAKSCDSGWKPAANGGCEPDATISTVKPTPAPSRTQDSSLKIEQVMTAQEVHQTGMSTLSPQQKNALNRWLLNYTVRILSTAQAATTQTPSSAQLRTTGSTCAPAIESTISGEFKDWGGETIFKLDNGQIWQQAQYDYTYSYSYRPDVTIYQTTAGCRMKVEDEDETILVKRIK